MDHLRIRLLIAAFIAVVVGVIALIVDDGDEPASSPSSPSTLDGTWRDLDGNGTLERAAGEPLLERTELAPASPPLKSLATLVQITDPHVRDEESPARASLLDRLDPVLNSTFRPQESLSTQVLASTVAAANAIDPDAVLLSGDLIDSSQVNELDQFLDVIEGGSVEPDSGGPGYEGSQEAENPDPFFYRPDLDAPTHPGLLETAQQPFDSPGVDAPWYPLPGNHDLLVQGEIPATPELGALATGDRLLSGVDRDLEVPDAIAEAEAADLSNEAALTPELVDAVIGQGLPGPTERVTPDPERAHLDPATTLSRLRSASGTGGSGPLMDYSFDLGPRVRVIALDLTNRAGGSTGVVHAGQPEWLRAELAAARGRLVIVMTHQPIDGSLGGEALLAELDRDPDVIATLAGDTHANSLDPRRSRAGGYWEIETSSLADYPQQARALRVVETMDGGVALETWMLDATGSTDSDVARELSYLDAQGGRPQGNAGEPGDRNARLYR